MVTTGPTPRKYVFYYEVENDNLQGLMDQYQDRGYFIKKIEPQGDSGTLFWVLFEMHKEAYDKAVEATREGDSKPRINL